MEPHPGLDRRDRALFTRTTPYHWITKVWQAEAVLRLLVSQGCAECGDTACSGADLSCLNMLDWVGGYWQRCCWKLMPSVHESHQRLLDKLMCSCCHLMLHKNAEQRSRAWPEMRNKFLPRFTFSKRCSCSTILCNYPRWTTRKKWIS